MKFVTIFAETKNIHLTKDVGMIPYIMYKEYGSDAEIACYKNGEYPYLNNEVKGLKMNFIKNVTGKSILDVGLYLLRNSKKIDILHLFHYDLKISFWICIYKLLNKKGKIYLKLDADYHIKKTTNPSFNSLKSHLKKFALNRCNLISVENNAIYNFLKNKWKIDVKYIPNGFYDYRKRQIVNSKTKENTILTVGRIGTYQKATEILLEGFKIANDKLSNWKLKIVGPIEKEFQNYINNFIYENPNLKSKIEFMGPIYNRNDLQIEYKKARIFCLTSRYESFGLVFLEAMQAGCYIISSDIESAEDVTDYETYGSIFKIDNVNELAESLIRNCSDDEKLNRICYEIQEYAYKKFYWPNLCKQILSYLDENKK